MHFDSKLLRWHQIPPKNMYVNNVHKNVPYQPTSNFGGEHVYINMYQYQPTLLENMYTSTCSLDTDLKCRTVF